MRCRGFSVAAAAVREGRAYGSQFVLAWVACLWVLAFKLLPAVSQEHVFLAGAATGNITPPLGSPIVGGFQPVPAEYVHDELLVRCMVLDDGKTRLAIVLCDNVGIPREVYDAAKTWVEQETKIPAGHVLTAATHTHSGTSARREDNRVAAAEQLSDYQRFVARRIADTVRCALQTLRPARIGWGKTAEPSQVFNRRWFVSDPALLVTPFGTQDRVRMNPPRGSNALLEPAGPVDPEICFISVQDLDGRPIAVLANYSLHYVGGVPAGHISADYFGFFAQKLAKKLHAEKLDPPFVAILSNGTSGNINNIDFRHPGQRMRPYEKIHQVAELVAERVAQAHANVTFRDWVPLDARYTTINLAVRKPTNDQLQWAESILASPEPPKDVRATVYARRFRELAHSPDTIEVPIQALRIGEVGIAAIPFEVFVETGLAIKKQSPFGQTFTIELANGSYGYLPTPEQHQLGGYETWLGTCSVEVEASPKIEASVLNLLKDLHEATKQ